MISRDVVFNENDFPCLPMFPTPVNDTSNKVDHVPVVVDQPAEHDGIVPNEVEHDNVHDIDDLHDSNVLSDSHDLPNDLHDYQLVRDRS